MSAQLNKPSTSLPLPARSAENPRNSQRGELISADDPRLDARTRSTVRAKIWAERHRRAGKHRRWTKRVEKFLKMARKGYSAETIAERLEVPVSKVRANLKKYLGIQIV